VPHVCVCVSFSFSSSIILRCRVFRPSVVLYLFVGIEFTTCGGEFSTYGGESSISSSLGIRVI
jgi:hypothetical protein